MSGREVINNCVKKIFILRRKQLVRASSKSHYRQLKLHNVPIKKLSPQQKNEIDAVFKKYGYKYSYDTHIICYSITGKFNAEIIPEDMFRTQMELKLNDFDTRFVFSDKNYFDYYMRDVRFPVSIIRNIEGVFYDKDYNIITESQAEKIASGYDKLVFKPSIDSGSGIGVELVDTKSKNPLKIQSRNYVIQEVLQQHSALSTLNESSVNVVRLETLFLDDTVYPITACLRIGSVGAFTDNFISKDGKGMIVVGIDNNGKLRENGYYACGLITKCNPAGIPFLGYEIPKYKEMVEIATKAHRRFPRLRFIGWDFTVNDKGEVVAMEYNIKYPGVLYYQYANGPLFGEITDKVLSYVKKLR